MTVSIYRHDPDYRESRGHLESCKFTDYKSPSCDCDDIPLTELVSAMRIVGWKVDCRGIEGDSFVRHYGPHLILLSRIIDGWQIKWEKGYGCTIVEFRGFASVELALDFFWGKQAEAMDESMQAFIDTARLRHENKTLKGEN